MKKKIKLITNCRKNSGFSLIELTFVIVIVAMVISTIIFTTQARLDVARIYTTKERIQIIIDSIERYAESFGHLPCPAQMDANRQTDNDYGWATGSAAAYATDPQGNCPQAISVASHASGDIVKGMVPVKSLIPALDPQIAVDGWGNRFSYIIMENYSVRDNYAGTGSYTTASISIANHPNTGSGYSSEATSEAVYVLISHGPNGHGAYRDRDGAQITISSPTNDDTENTDTDRVFSQSMPLAEYYDDILISKTRWQLPDPIN